MVVELVAVGHNLGTDIAHLVLHVAVEATSLSGSHLQEETKLPEQSVLVAVVNDLDITLVLEFFEFLGRQTHDSCALMPIKVDEHHI